MLATLGLGLFPPFFVWSTGGLETMAFALATFLAFDRLALDARAPHVWQAALAGGAMVLLRVDGLAWAGVIGGASTWVWLTRAKRGESRLPTQALITVGGVVVAAWLCQLGFRWLYYDTLVPNTATVKVGMSVARIGRGWDYAAVYHLTFLTPILLLVVSGLALRGRLLSARQACGAIALVPIGQAIAVSGDFMAMGRLFVVGLPFGAILLGSLLSARWTRTEPGGQRALAALSIAAIGLGALPAFGVHIAPEGLRKQFHFRHNTPRFRSELEQWEVMGRNVDRWTEIARATRRFADPEDSVVRGPIGAFGYHSGLFVYDRNGLVTREVAVEPAMRFRSPGHEQVRAVGLLPRLRADVHGTCVYRNRSRPLALAPVHDGRVGRSHVEGWKLLRRDTRPRDGQGSDRHPARREPRGTQGPNESSARSDARREGPHRPGRARNADAEPSENDRSGPRPGQGCATIGISGVSQSHGLSRCGTRTSS